MYHYIAIEGNIGVGKTSLTELLSRELLAYRLLENFQKNEFLPFFYKDSGSHAFALELEFLFDRYKQLGNSLFRHKHLLISDFLFDKSSIFSGVTLNSEEFRVFTHVFETFKSKIPIPDLVIFLENSLENLLINIRKRARDFEMNISLEYLSKIDKSYKDFLAKNTSYRVIRLDVSNIDFVSNPSDLRKIINILSSEYKIGNTNIVL